MPGLDPEKRKLGQVVLDFVNAEDTDEAAFRFFENIQDVFGFSPDFSEKAKKSFPLLRVFEELSAPKKDALTFFRELENHIRVIEENNYNEVQFRKIDYEGKLHFSVFSIDASNDPLDPDVTEEKLSCSLGELKSAFDRLSLDRAGILSIDFLEEEYITETETKINTIISSLSKKDFDEVMNYLELYPIAKKFHEGLAYLQKQFSKIIDQIIKKVPLDSIPKLTEECKAFYEIYSSRRELVFSGNEISTRVPSDREWPYIKDWPGSITLTPFDRDITACFIEFLLEPGSFKYLSQCKNEDCRKYFLKTILKEQKFCSKKCHDDFHNQERTKSGENREYKKKRKEEGKATASYY